MIYRLSPTHTLTVAALLMWLCSSCAAQSSNQYAGAPFPPIHIPSLERAMSEGRQQAMRENKPELEYFVVKTFVREYVTERRQSASQEIVFDYPEKLREWITDVAKRCNRDEAVVTADLVLSLAPNRCPDLKLDDKRTPDDLKSRARDEMQSRLPSGAARSPAPDGPQSRRIEAPRRVTVSDSPDRRETSGEADESTETRTVITIGTPAATEARRSPATPTATTQKTSRRRY